MARCTYLCPIRFTSANQKVINDFRAYWKFLERQGCEVLVVDGSSPEVFKTHAREWLHCRHISVDRKYRHLNGKVNGIMTGITQAGCEKIILADDDIRYSEADINRMIADLEEYEVVRPQNFFHPLTWWTKIDTARILINRATLREGDYPGTFGFRKSVFEAAGPFDGDVLFDNEELLRHLKNHGAHTSFATDFMIVRRPPAFNKWLEQRPRQAYEDFVMKAKTGLFLSILPVQLLAIAFGKRPMRLALSMAGFSTILALFGRKRDRAIKYFPWHTMFFAPLWVLERAVSVYLALYWKYAKGGYPFGDKVLKKGTGYAWKRNSQKTAQRSFHPFPAISLQKIRKSAS